MFFSLWIVLYMLQNNLYRLHIVMLVKIIKNNNEYIIANSSSV